MKNLFFTAIIISLASICRAQQNQMDSAGVKFTPPVIIKDSGISGSQNQKALRFTPPIIKEKQTSKGSETKKKEAVKFTPPVIIKDSEKKE